MDWDIDIDARGLRCPLPVLRLRKELGRLAPGQIARLEADDPMAQVDVPHFCAEQDHVLLSTETTETGAVFLVARKG